MKSLPLMAILAALALAVPLAGAAYAQPQGMTGAAPAPVPAPDQAEAASDRFARARDNLVAILDGRLTITALTPLELQDVIDLDRALRGNAAQQPSFRQQCIDDEVRRAGGRPSRLAWEVIRLKCR